MMGANVRLNAFSRAIVRNADSEWPAIIAEVKVSTPAVGDLLRGRSIGEIVRAYERGGAAAVSVVTGRWFGGTLEMLDQALKATTLPILRKDFIINSREVERSRDLGASAVLLTKKLLSAEHLGDLISCSHECGLTPFVEIADIHELQQVRLGAGMVVAVATKEIQHRERGLPDFAKATATLATAPRITDLKYASASGVENADDVRRLGASGFDGCLVGTSLLRASCLDDKVEELCRSRLRADARMPVC